MLFYRIENLKGEGPYINCCEMSLMKWLELYDVFSVGDNRWEEYMDRHPSPGGKDSRIKDCLSYRTNGEDFIFGFNNLNKLKQYFFLKEEIEYLSYFNFGIRVYDIQEKKDSYFVSKYQMIANKKLISPIEYMSLTEVFGEIA